MLRRAILLSEESCPLGSIDATEIGEESPELGNSHSPYTVSDAILLGGRGVWLNTAKSAVKFMGKVKIWMPSNLRVVEALSI